MTLPLQQVRVESWLTRAARRRPDTIAVGGLRYAALDAAADGAARALAARGARAGDRVGIALADGADFAVALHGVWRLGAVAVPLDLRLTARERPPTAVTIEEPLRAGGPSVALVGEHDLDAPAVVVFTSGTTAAPRPVELTFGNWLWSALGSGVALGVAERERWLCALPLAHVGGLSILVRSAIYATTATVHERFDLERVLAALRDASGPTLISLVPTTLTRLLDAGLERPPALRWALLGGAPVPSALLERAAAAGVPVATTYGLTEACSQVTTRGAPLFCTQVTLAPDGEVLVSGPTVAAGSGPVLATGDLGHWAQDGTLAIVGRRADTIVSGGENIAPAEVEAALEEHPAIVEAGVWGRQDADWGEAVVAAVVLRGVVRGDELRRHCAARLARFKIPKAFVAVDALPRTASGKLLRTGLPGLWSATGVREGV